LNRRLTRNSTPPISPAANKQIGKRRRLACGIEGGPSQLAKEGPRRDRDEYVIGVAVGASYRPSMVVKFDSAHFRVWLGNQMRARHMSQRMLGERAGVDHSTISRLLRTGRTPSTETMVALAAALGAQLPTYLAAGETAGLGVARIRRALTELGVDPIVVDEMLAVYRRSRLQAASGGKRTG